MLYCVIDNKILFNSHKASKGDRVHFIVSCQTKLHNSTAHQSVVVQSWHKFERCCLDNRSGNLRLLPPRTISWRGPSGYQQNHPTKSRSKLKPKAKVELGQWVVATKVSRGSHMSTRHSEPVQLSSHDWHVSAIIHMVRTCSRDPDPFTEPTALGGREVKVLVSRHHIA